MHCLVFLHGFTFMFQTLFINNVEFTQFFFCAIIILIDVSLFCLVGHETTTSYENIFEKLCSHWNYYELPLDIQKIIPLILMSAEKPVYLKGPIAVCCDREFIQIVCNPIDVWQKKFL